MVDLAFTAEEEQFRTELRAYLDASIPAEWRVPGYWLRVPEAESFDRRRQWEREKADAGFGGIAWPKEYGGRGGTPGMKAIYDIEMRAASAPISVNQIGLTFLAPTVMLLGSEEQKRTIIPRMLRNDDIWCQGFSEPGAGSDLAALRTSAVRDGDEYVINGQKVWTTDGMHGEKIFVLARTTPDGASKHAGITMFLADMKQEGVTVRPLKQMSGASEFCETFFDDARVPADSNLGGIDNGWATAMLLLSFERGSSALGQYAEFSNNLEWVARVAQQLGKEGDPDVRRRLGRCVADLEALKDLSYHILTQAVQGKDLGFEASMTKIAWTHAYQQVFETFDDLLGEDVTITEPYPGLDLAPLIYGGFWSRSTTIWGGSHQVQLNVVAERVLGLPR